MDAAEVDKAVVVALAGYIENDYVSRVCREHHDRLIPGASVNPCAHTRPEIAKKECIELFGNREFKVLKLHPRLNGYDPLDERCLAVLEVLSELKPPVPVWLDTLFRGNKCMHSKPPVETIQELAFRFPHLPMVLLHGGGSLLLQMSELLGGFPNLTLDLSLTLMHYPGSSLESDLAFVIAKRDLRTVAGSDFPEYTPLQYVTRVRSLAKKTDSSEGKIKRVTGGNLANILQGSLA
jgi:predicted TIM-barrel fold metal-dependent hydrolase